jgi:hypothetical protein
MEADKKMRIVIYNIYAFSCVAKKQMHLIGQHLLVAKFSSVGLYETLNPGLPFNTRSSSCSLPFKLFIIEKFV